MSRLLGDERSGRIQQAGVQIIESHKILLDEGKCNEFRKVSIQ
jgi:hypothetical protein